MTAESPYVPSVTSVYPTADWQERETYDMFGVVFDGHPNLTRILMPDDWEGYPQRKDYPLGGVPVEYKGAEIPPPDQRRRFVPSERGYAETRRRARRPRARSSPSPAATGTRSSAAPTPSTTSASSSTWGRSTRPRTACSASSSSSRARPSPRPAGRRLPAHGHREEPRVPQLGAGHDVRDPDGLSRPDLQRDRRTAWRSRSCSASRTQITERATAIRVLMMELNRIASHLVWLGTTGLELGAISMMLYGFREREFILEIFEMVSGPADEHGLRPSRRRGPGRAARGDHEDPRVPRLHAQASSTSTRPCSPAADLDRAHQGRRRPRRHRMPCARASPARSCARPGSAGTCAARCRTAATRRTTSTCRRRRRPTSGVATRSAWPRCGESLKIIEQAWNGCEPGPDHGGGQEDRVAGPARHRRRTGWATRSSTSRRSWASRWSR